MQFGNSPKIIKVLSWPSGWPDCFRYLVTLIKMMEDKKLINNTFTMGLQLN